MKRIVSILLCVLLVLSILAAAFANVFAAEPSTMPKEEDIINIVGALEIMNGDENGNLNLDKNVTRAEFIKIALCTSSLKDSINVGSTSSLFSDLRASHWAIGYVSVGVKNGYIKGYLDGTFRPDNHVTLEEAVTVMLRIMGYSELDSGKYPETQLAKYEELKLDSNISAKRGDTLTRRECMYLSYNALCATDKTGKVYCETLGYQKDENGRIDYLALINNKLEGAFIAKSDSDLEMVPNGGNDYKIYHESKLVDKDYVKQNDVYYYSKQLKTVWLYRDSITGRIDDILPNRTLPTSVTINGKSYSFSNTDVAFALSTLGNINIRDIVTLLIGRNGEVVGILDNNQFSTEIYGFVTAFSEAEFSLENGTSYIADTVEIVGIDSESYTYENEGKGLTKGDFVKVTYNGDIPVITPVSKGTTGAYDYLNTLVASGEFSADAYILDTIITFDKNSLDDKSVQYLELSPSRLEGAVLKSNNVYYYEIENNKITMLILNDFTGDMYNYGMAISERNGRYTFITEKTEENVNFNTAYMSLSITPVRVVERDGQKTIYQLSELKVDKGGLSRSGVVCQNKRYLLSYDVRYYLKKGTREYVASNFAEITEGNYNLKAYYDNTEENGGRIRVIVAE